MEPLSSSEYDEIYGKTPPRTKMLRKYKERKNRYSGSTMISQNNIQTTVQFSRRNIPNTLYNNFELHTGNFDTNEGLKRTNKRQMKLLRGSERDLKLDISTAQVLTNENSNGENCHYPRTPGYQIECSKPFMSLMCRTFPCNKITKNTDKTPIGDSVSNDNDEECLLNCSSSKIEFYQTLKALIRMGSGDKYLERNTRRVISREETLWHNELKDVIWLELQAYHAERTPMEEDCYLCSERLNVEPLLNDIKNYRFQKHYRRYSTQNSDSGVEDDCSGCLSVFCLSCLETQNDALREIESLLSRLENVENLFPSSKAFAELYPLYNSSEIVGRVKAMCLWYNMVKHQRLKLNILGKFINMLDTKQGDWPLLGDENNSGSPSDSNNSTNSSSSDGLTSIYHRDLYDITPIATLLSKKDNFKDSPYRRYIENVLKTRALNKSIKFLNSLHENVLQKTKLTLLHWDKSSTVIFESEEEELRRFGAWSPEARNMNLPSYRAMFLFLALVPLEVVNAYLQMRLEQKPEKPSPLSIRQLMRELKDGLQFALHERRLAFSYIEYAVSGTDINVKDLWEKISCVDKCISEIFKDYLEYLEKWILLNKNNFKKNFVEEEYEFCVEVCEYMDSCKELLDEKFVNIFCSTLTQLGDSLLQKIEDILGTASECEAGSLKQTLFSVCRELQNLFNRKRELSLKIMAFGKTCFKNIIYKNQYGKIITEAIVGFKCIIPCAIAKVQALFEHISIVTFDDIDKNALNSRIREILMQCYRFGFDFYKEMADATSPEFRKRLVESMVEFASLWMKFVTERCERGRGMRPRWAYQGMEFLLTVCEPENTQHLSEGSFDNLKKEMDVCISHVIGTSASTTPDSDLHSISPRTSLEPIRIRSRGSSPSTRPAYKSQRSGICSKINKEQTFPRVDTSNSSTTKSFKNVKNHGISIVRSKAHIDRYRDAVDALENEIDSRLKHQHLIGRVIQDRTSNKNSLFKRVVTFSWQRGIKIGQGRFGKVYTAVNNNTGDMMAVKKIALQLNDSTTVKRVAEEMKILEGIIHDNLVRYYGVEIRKEEMLLFMEYCSEGTLENLIAASEGGLPELLLRRYTYQLVYGVACIHEHGIVHRDIKTANIFLTNGGNCLKIGDFGCAVKIKSNVTMPGELNGFVGTQAYMAPEVFTRNMSEGHGRAADIWSVGCVVVEMASGKRPWAQYDSNFQIMFKVGMGQSPDPPDDMIEEGLDFLEMCFKHDPKERATARELLSHNFIKIGEDLICC